MRLEQIIFNVVALFVGGFFVVSALGILFLVMPNSPPDDRGIWHFSIAIEAIIILTVGGGAITNFASGRISTWPTAFIIAGYCISIWLLPLAIWGGFLLRSAIRQRALAHRDASAA